MNTLTTVIIVGSLVTLLLGVLLGWLRGMKRSILRFALLALCFVLSFALCGAVADAVAEIPVSDGQTLSEMMTSSFSESGEAIADIVLSMVQILVKIISFLLVFVLLQVISWLIVFPILKLVLRPILGRSGRKRGRGALVGALCGLLVAFALFVPLNGLFCEVSKLASVSVDLAGLISDGDDEQQEAKATDDMSFTAFAVNGSTSGMLTHQVALASSVDGDLFDQLESTGIIDYADSGISKFYSSLGGGFYRSLATVTDKNGKKVNLTTQIDALSAAASLASKATTLKDVMNEDGTVNVATIKDFAKTLTELDELTPEVKTVLNDMVKAATESLGDDVPDAIKNLDIEQIDFKTEGNLLATVADVVENEGSLENVDIDEVVKNLSESTVILPALAESDVTIPVDEETKAKAESAIADLEAKTGDEAVDAETIAKLKALFGTATDEENN